MRAGLVVLCVLSAAVVGATAQQDQYSDKYDRVDLDEVLRNERLLRNYVLCLLEARLWHCTPAGRALKRRLAEVLATDCTRCTTKQRSGAQKVIKHLLATRPADWMRIAAKFNPDGEFLRQHPDLSV